MQLCMVIVQTCDHFFRPKSQLVRYPNRETMGNNDKQMNDVLLFLRPMREHLTSSSIIAVFFFFLIALKIIHSVFFSNGNRFDYTFWLFSFFRY